jgi:hypothetical protein
VTLTAAWLHRCSVRHCARDALTSGDADDAQAKAEEMLAAVQRFARTR